MHGSEFDSANERSIPLRVIGAHNQINARMACRVVAAAAGLDHSRSGDLLADFPGLPHRLQFVAEHDGLRFYNDSKSTTTTSTRAAIEKLQGKSIIVFIGGLSKGVDRAHFIKELKGKVKHVYCFGAEAETLRTYCATNNIPAQDFATLDDAFEACVNKVTPQDCILFSPAGSSYDLFKDYEERGNYFKKLVRDYNTDTDINK